jgi:phosphate:Na+ symporter
MPLFNAITLIVGGLIFFIFALQVVTRSFQNLSGVYLKVAINLLAKNRLSGALIGVVLSFLLASTSGATVLLVGMGDAGLITLRQALAVILGAAVGTSLTVQVIAFDIGNWSLYLVAAGFLLRVFARYERWRDVGDAVFGVGMLFFGLAMMKSGAQASESTESIRSLKGFLATVSANPFYLFLLGIGATAILQSSATTLAMAFAFGLPVVSAIPMAIGASIGTCTAGLVSGIASRPIGRQIALGHFVMKLLAGLFFMTILQGFINSVETWSTRLHVSSPERVIANANTLYTALTALIFLPMLPLVEELVAWITRRQRRALPVADLSARDLDEPEAAVDKARRQVVRMGRTALDMLRQDLPAFMVGPHKVTDDILAGEDSLDTYDAVISDFLSRLDESRLSPRANKDRTRLLYAVKNIEYLGDVLASELVPLALKKSRKGLEFSIEGAQHFERFHRLVADDLAETIDLLEGLPANARRVLDNDAHVDTLRQEIVEAHIRRVSHGVRADAETTRILLDAIAALRTIHYYTTDVVKVLES